MKLPAAGRRRTAVSSRGEERRAQPLRRREFRGQGESAVAAAQRLRRVALRAAYQSQIVDEARVERTDRHRQFLRRARSAQVAGAALDHRQQVERPGIVGAHRQCRAAFCRGALDLTGLRQRARLLEQRPDALEQRVPRGRPLGVNAIADLREAGVVPVASAAGAGVARVGVPLERLLRHEVEPRALRELEEEVPVLVDGERLVEAAPGQHQGAREHRRGQVDVIALVELDQRVGLTEALAVPVAEHAAGVGVDDAGGRRRCTRGHQRRQVSGQEDVVVVEKTEPLAPGGVESGVGRRGPRQLPGTGHQAQRKRPAPFRQRRMRRAAGSHDDDLGRRIVLGGDRRQRGRERRPRHAAHDDAQRSRNGAHRGSAAARADDPAFIEHAAGGWPAIPD